MNVRGGRFRGSLDGLFGLSGVSRVFRSLNQTNQTDQILATCREMMRLFLGLSPGLQRSHID